MNLINHSKAQAEVAEAISDSIIIKNEQDALRLLEEVFAFGASNIILHKENIAPEFFDLKTGLAGVVLQKFANYNIRVAIVGDFTNITSKSLNAFIYESSSKIKYGFVRPTCCSTILQIQLEKPPTILLNHPLRSQPDLCR
jgi:hypothetical protein